ncbi:MAG: hypothetical protein MAG795_01266 [Candidatus Woesearchaeota archaeon]|nr:hypothetical protein [Candidatus Woesearchaeota archaeon]
MKHFNENKLRIGIAFLQNLDSRLYLRQISRIADLDVKIIFRELNELTDVNILDYIKKGRMKLYFLKKNIETELFLIMCETYKAQIFLKQHKKLKPKLLELYKKTDFAIFGSYAEYKNKKGSDLDIVIFSTDERKLTEKFQNLHPHFIEFNEFRQQARKQSGLAREIVKNHILFGKYKQFVRLLEWTD